MCENMGAFFRDYWPILTAAGAVAGYFITHWRELSWKRTEFICAQLKELGDDPAFFEILKILEKRHATLTIEKIFNDGSDLAEAERNECRQEFDRFLNYIWCLCFAYLNLGTLTTREIVCIGRYLKLITEDPLLVSYCEGHGYTRIITVARRLKEESLYNT